MVTTPACAAAASPATSPANRRAAQLHAATSTKSGSTAHGTPCRCIDAGGAAAATIDRRPGAAVRSRRHQLDRPGLDGRVGAKRHAGAAARAAQAPARAEPDARRHAPGRCAPEHAPDPMRLEVFNALFMHVAEQMGAVLRQTASSVNIKERLDFSCAVFDADANLVANAPHMPVHLGSMGASVAAVLETHGARPAAGRCVPAELAVRRRHAPAGHDRRVAGVRCRSAERSNSSRRRARTTPTSAASRRGRCRRAAATIDEEGALIAPTSHRARRRAGRKRSCASCCAAGAGRRATSVHNLADLRAQLAANARGRARAAAAPVRNTAAQRVLEYMRHVQDNAERLHAARHPPIARRQLPLRTRQRPGDRRAHRRRHGGRHGTRRFHGHLACSRRTISMRRAPSRSPRCCTCSAR